MSHKNILITGGLGYTGSMLTEALMCSGHNVVIVDVDLFGSKLTKIFDGLKIYSGDIRFLKWEKILQSSFDCVVHLAAVSNDPGYGISKEIGTAVNYDASVRLYDSCVYCGVKRFIFPSSCSVYGHIEASCRELDESAELHPLTLYSRTKADFERYISAHPSYMDCVVLRPATVYGFSYRQRFDLLFNRLIISAYYGVRTETPHINNVRPALFLPDLIKIYMMLIESPQKVGGIYNAAGENLTVGEGCNIISREIGRKAKFEHSYNAPNTERSYSVSSAKLCNFFGGFRFTSMAEGTKSFMRRISRKIFDDYLENDAYYNARKQHLYFS